MFLFSFLNQIACVEMITLGQINKMLAKTVSLSEDA